MKPLSKKEAQTKIEEAIFQTLEKLELTKVSKKTKKLVKEASRKLTGTLRKEIKKLNSSKKKIEKLKNVKPEKEEVKKIEEVVPVEEAKIAS